MPIWLKEIAITIGVFIIMGSLCLLVLVAYYYYENWWDSRHAVAKHPDYKPHKSIGYLWGHSIVKGVTKIFAKNKGEKSR